ncbi:Restriction endonuclease [Leuconostoc gasicomitatum]|uniref:restriction endonuclease n=1 Tax=Leuconostoc gasicomitatum TaxID=115778 RepID=UPI000BD21FBD|nr:restriction endonuclease [Leuconostoc gasicomitatum]MBZ5943964.1 restriction endonuclease [Leuconostoc gasicomitatum]MBZ5949215.1 restriction endonuclease [Leuconostoc gasicomitatum]MBZ5951245.1 restriction endonuclease [Leuconostoc gasicomitatum]MBZ5967228.1 restriction endonuclease [Leuconostoc gasicomitatum]MBZ5971347.1 restriction endonuclease [Leuconostoc gasicomitatum]
MKLNDNDQEINKYRSTDILENTIRETMPEILNILLMDRTTSKPRKVKNIIWANENYIKYGSKFYAATSQIRSELVTGQMGQIIKPRALKSRELQKERTKTRAEVFTPTWVVKRQNDEVEKDYLDDDLETYVSRTWLEITTGEAPYMATRYDMETGEFIPLIKRVGFVDRKLRRINAEVDDKAEWQRLVVKAYKASYGFEWSGDSLLLARENLLYTYRDFYFDKWLEEPVYGLFEDIAEIISYNLFQMDGLKYVIPMTEKKEKVLEYQVSLFDDETPEEQWKIKPGKRVKIMNWKTNKMEFFDKGVK